MVAHGKKNASGLTENGFCANKNMRIYAVRIKAQEVEPMQPKQLALLSDLDGTLFNSEGRISPENAAAIREFIKAGGLFSIATGREPRNALQYLEGVPMNAPAIVLNGAGVYDYGTGSYLFLKHLDTPRLYPFFSALLARFPEADMQIYTAEEGIVYVTPEEQAQPGLLKLHQPCRFIPLDVLRCEYIKSMIICPGREAAGAEGISYGGRSGRSLSYCAGNSLLQRCAISLL